MAAGIIPACAGSTVFRCIRVARVWDHPRMCGEHPPPRAVPKNAMGSSPHVRGAPRLRQRARRHRGIIPACAGSTLTAMPAYAGIGDHPRMCGEHYTTKWDDSKHMGSSPHVRGALGAGEGHVVEQGIIPACAGSTQSPSSRASRYWDHPRMCGEHADGTKTIQGAKGSSPHVRGARIIHGVVRVVGGIIPACAGSTPRSAPPT